MAWYILTSKLHRIILLYTENNTDLIYENVLSGTFSENIHFLFGLIIDISSKNVLE